jgi:hypothetical protein
MVVEFDSTVGTGSTFSFALHLAYSTEGAALSGTHDVA